MFRNSRSQIVFRPDIVQKLTLGAPVVFLYKAANNLVFIDSEALPATRQSTRSTRSLSSNAITYIPKQPRTVTYQRSFFIRACRT